MQLGKRFFLVLIATIIITFTAVLTINTKISPTDFTSNIALADEDNQENSNDEQVASDLNELVDKANKNELSENEKEQLEIYRKQDKIKQDGDEYTLGNAARPDEKLWTLYSRILMESGEGKDGEKQKEGSGIEKMVTNAIGKFMGDGGVEVTIPFNKMYSIGVDLDKAHGGNKKDGKQAGRQLASFFATFSHYGYIETVSGNTIASNAKQGFTTFLRGVAGVIMILAVLIHAFFNSLLGSFVSFIGKLDIFSLMGFNDTETFLENTKNPVVKAIYGFFQGIGLTPAAFHFIMMTSFYVIVAMFVFRMMRTLSNDAFHFGQIGDHTRRLIVRFLTLFAVPSILIILVSGFAKHLDDLGHSNKFNPTPAQQYILNDRKWAAALNLSPTALQQGLPPNAGSDTQHIDANFAPSNSRNLISQINYESYNRMDGIEDENSMKMSFDLIFGYMQNNTFNVNTYMADIRQTPASGSEAVDSYAAYKNMSELDSKITQQNYEDYIWTSKPISSSNEEDAKPTAKNYNPSSIAGVEDEMSFSTQSVALMVQTSFDNNAATFYAYNIPPTGIQGYAKNMSTVKTQWREYTMPGEGIIGKLGSYLAMITQSIFQTLIILGCIHALIFTNFFKSTILAFKHWFLGFSTGNPAHMLVCLVLGLTAPLSGYIAYALPSLLVSAINILASGVNGVVKAFDIQNIDGIIDVTKSVVFIFAGFYLVIAKTVTGTNIITACIAFFTDMGLELAKKAESIMRTRQQARHAIRLMNRSARAVGASTASDVAKGTNKTTMSATWNAIRTPSEWASHGKAYMSNQAVGKDSTDNAASSNPDNQSAREFARQQSMYGQTAPTGRTGTARNTLLGNESPHNVPSNNPYGGHNYFAGSMSIPKNEEPQDTENHARNKIFKNDASILPAAMKSGSANEFAKNYSKENKQDDMNSDKPDRGRHSQELHHPNTDNTSTDNLTNLSSYGSIYQNSTNGESANEFASRQAPFNDRELNNLSSSKDVDDFQEKLYFTRNGQNIALSQDDAKIELQGTRFINRDGDVDYSQIDMFNSNINGRHIEELNNDEMKQKEQIDYAFRKGASSIYEKYDSEKNK